MLAKSRRIRGTHENWQAQVGDSHPRRHCDGNQLHRSGCARRSMAGNLYRPGPDQDRLRHHYQRIHFRLRIRSDLVRQDFRLDRCTAWFRPRHRYLVAGNHLARLRPLIADLLALPRPVRRVGSGQLARRNQVECRVVSNQRTRARAGYLQFRRGYWRHRLRPHRRHSLRSVQQLASHIHRDWRARPAVARALADRVQVRTCGPSLARRGGAGIHPDRSAQPRDSPCRRIRAKLA